MRAVCDALNGGRGAIGGAGTHKVLDKSNQQHPIDSVSRVVAPTERITNRHRGDWRP